MAAPTTPVDRIGGAWSTISASRHAVQQAHAEADKAVCLIPSTTGRLAVELEQYRDACTALWLKASELQEKLYDAHVAELKKEQEVAA